MQRSVKGRNYQRGPNGLGLAKTSVQLPRSILARVQALAGRRGLSVSAVVAHLVALSLDRDLEGAA